MDLDIVLRIKEIFNQSNFLEIKINEVLEDFTQEDNHYDVLIVEDDLSTIMVLSDFFKMHDYEVRGVTTATKALEELRRHKPKLILLDIILPDIDGFDLCQKIKFDEMYEDYRNIPIYYITAIPESKVMNNIERTGADGVFYKPFKFSEIKGLFDII